MSAEGKTVVKIGGGGLFTVFLVFLILKLTGTINWSWWWVTAPIWMPYAFAILLGLFGLAGLGLFWCWYKITR